MSVFAKYGTDGNYNAIIRIGTVIRIIMSMIIRIIIIIVVIIISAN